MGLGIELRGVLGWVGVGKKGKIVVVGRERVWVVELGWASLLLLSLALVLRVRSAVVIQQ